jgi:hypothetical protein
LVGKMAALNIKIFRLKDQLKEKLTLLEEKKNARVVADAAGDSASSNNLKDEAIKISDDIKGLEVEILKQNYNRKINSMELYELFDYFSAEVNKLKQANQDLRQDHEKIEAVRSENQEEITKLNQEIVALKQENATLAGRVFFLEDHSKEFQLKKEKDVLNLQLKKGEFLLDPTFIQGFGLSVSTNSLRGIKTEKSPSCVLGNRSFYRGVGGGGGGGGGAFSKVSWGVRFLVSKKTFSYEMFLGVHISPSTMKDRPWIGNYKGEEGVYALSFSMKGDPQRYHGGRLECEDGKGRDPDGNERRVAVGDEVIVTLDCETGTLSFSHLTPPTYCSYLRNLPLHTPLYPYFNSWDVEFEIFFIV